MSEKPKDPRFPRFVPRFPGILQPVCSQEEYDRVVRNERITVIIAASVMVGSVAIGTGFLVAVLFHIVTS